MQLRRLDPLANAGPYQRLSKNPVKSFTLTQSQYDYLQNERPELVVTAGEGAVIGFPYRDSLDIHYAFPDIEAFRELFPEMFNAVSEASSGQEAPRGAVLRFRDRPNRKLSETVFWSVGLDEGPEWVEMNLVSAPELPEPGSDLAEGYSVREASDKDLEAIADLDGANGRPPLTANGLETLARESRTGQLITDASGKAAGFFNLRSEPGGWGILETPVLRPDLREKLAHPVLRWAMAWLRNSGSRRIRQTVLLDDNASLAALRQEGFQPGEQGLTYTRPVDLSEVQNRLDERKAHGSMIRFGNWR